MEYELLTSSLPQETKVLSAVERVFFNRGMPPQIINHYLHTTDDDILDPSTINNMENGAKMLIQHISQNDDIFIQIDPDADGYTSAAALINYLYHLFPSFVKSHLIYRLSEGKRHGIVPELIPESVKLTIAPDSSSNSYTEHKILKDRGCDVLVIDHHEAEYVSPDACIINNQLCDYPTKSLSGVGMVYKFCSYIDQCLNINLADDFLDLVAIGCIGDMMDLRDFETKRLVDKGLNQIRNPYLKGMIDTQHYSIDRHGGLDPFSVSFYIAPQINATIRVGTQDEKLMLFESMLDFRGYEQIPSTKRGCKGQMETRVEQACRNCTNIKSRQTKARDVSLETIEQIIEDNDLLSNKILTIQAPQDVKIDKNLTGLIANQLMAKYMRPVLLLNPVIQEDGTTNWEGSGRGYEKSKFDCFKDYLSNCEYVNWAQGHQNAFGTSISESNFNNFVAYSNNYLKDIDFTPCHKVDFILQSNNFNRNDIIEIAELKSVWGQGLEEPLVAVENVVISKSNIQLMSPDKSPTLKITLSNGTSLIKFKSSMDEYNDLYSELGCVKINIVGVCERNIWNGQTNPQIIIEDYEIVERLDYYF